MMETQQACWQSGEGWGESSGELSGPADVVLVFGSPSSLQDEEAMSMLEERWPGVPTIGCSTAGEIHGVEVSDDSIVATAVHFQDTPIHIAELSVEEGADSADIGRQLAEDLPSEGLRHVIVFSDGLHVNGSGLVHGMRAALPQDVQVTGGLAGDGDRFERTVVVGAGKASDFRVSAMGLYGDNIKIGYGSLGGWDPFGPLRRVTRSKDNVLYELDGQPALSLYKEYLGDKAAELPASGLLFPLSVQVPGKEREVVRTILAVDEDEQSLTFAGDVPEGSTARLMKANFDRLVDGAQGAAKTASISGEQAELGLLISCVGRKLVLKQRTEDELEAVQQTLGPQATLAGFYSYGEICPAAPDADCDLHNQTMTITTLREG